MQRLRCRRAARRPTREPVRDAQEARPPERARLRIIGQRREMLFAEREQFLRSDRPAGWRRTFSVKSPMAPWMTVPRSRAPGGVSTGIERLQAQDIAGVDRVGIAQPVLDLGDRQPRRPRRERRLRRRALGGFHVAPDDRARGRARDSCCRARATSSQRARRRARRCAARSARPRSARRRAWRRGEDDFRRAERLREVVRGQADAALGRIEAEIAAHRPAEPGIAARLRRPGAFVEAAEHDAVDRLQARFQRAEDAHAHVARFRAAHHAVADGGVEQFGIVACARRRGRRRTGCR